MSKEQESGEDCIMRSSMICTPRKVLFGGQITENEMSGECGIWGWGKCTWDLVGKHEVKRPCGRCKHRWENHININVQERGWEGMDCITQTQSRANW